MKTVRSNFEQLKRSYMNVQAECPFSTAGESDQTVLGDLIKVWTLFVYYNVINNCTPSSFILVVRYFNQLQSYW